MQLGSPDHVVVGATDLEGMEAFLGRFEFHSHPLPDLEPRAAQALYGLEGPCRQRRLVPEPAEQGWIRLVETPHAHRQGGAYDARPLAVDLYTRSIEKSLAIAAGARAHFPEIHCGELVEYEVGPLAIREAEVIGPDGLVVVFLEVSQRRSSLLDRVPERLHSEVHSVVLAVDSAGEALPFWQGPAGLDTLIDAPIEGAMISRLMNLPRPNVPVRFVLLADDACNPTRFELLEFSEDAGETRPTWPLAAGLHAPGFSVSNLDTALQTLGEAEAGALAQLGTGARGVSLVAPGQVRFELWQGVWS